MSQATVVAALIEHIYENREALSKDKYSDVHFVPGMGYRIHKHAIVPAVVNSLRVDNVIKAVVEINYPNTMVWDGPSLWLTIPE